jgi:uncharacterized protein (DUF608 family)
MSLKEERRKFLKQLTLGGVGAAALPKAFLDRPDVKELESQVLSSSDQKPQSDRKFNGSYQGKYITHVAFPIGGIGAGMFCLEGTGAISDMSIRNSPHIFNQPDIFAAISVKNRKNGAKILEGPVPDWKVFEQPGASNGNPGAIYGLPRFQQAEFKARFPFGLIDLKDKDIPFDVHITGWNPFTPGDPDNSSLPVGGLEYTFKNTSGKSAEAVFSFNSENFVAKPTSGGSVAEHYNKGSIKKMTNGFVLSQSGLKNHPEYEGDFAVFTDEPGTKINYHWFRGGWWDPLTMVWNTIAKGAIKTNNPIKEGAPGASLFVPFRLAPGQKKTIRIMTAWYVPNTDLRAGKNDVTVEKGCTPAAGCCSSPTEIGIYTYGKKDDDLDHKYYKPWYGGKFDSVYEVAKYWKKNYSDLRKKSMLFRKAFYSITLPPVVLEAVAANLTILKSPTVMRQQDGRMWNWEGCSDNNGCCAGSCTHVWNYAQALPHLFPSMARSLRLTEFCEDQNLEGHQNFRASLPIRPTGNTMPAAADGQLGGIMKMHRDWQISGDTEWLKKLYPMVKKSLDYCIKTWDPEHKGLVIEPHHNTYDIEFWGPGGMCTSFYLGALKAMIAMGSALNKDVSLYKRLYKKGKKYLENELFNGEYFYQKVEWKHLKVPNPVKVAEKKHNMSEEALALFKKEGPKYQYGTGCLSDGILGTWIARMCGIEEPVANNQKIKSHLLAVHKYNLKRSLVDHANPQRSTYALGDEGGLLLCTWPRGGKPELPFVYSDEVWTGISYHVASHLMMMGEVEKGLEIVKILRTRYDGTVRNPFNEYECGSWYARAMSSYGLLRGLTGVCFDALEKTLYVDSKVGDFTSFLSTQTGFGTVSLKNGKLSLKIYHGKIPVEKAVISGEEKSFSKSTV